MVAPPEHLRTRTAAELTRWLERDVGPALRKETEAIAHGGTALTLLGIKGSTKDVDLAFRSREAFDGFVSALGSLGFIQAADFRATPREVFHRLQNPASTVDVVDVRFPTWNNWRLSKAVLRKAVILPLSRVRLVRPDRDAVFLFKTYPLRETDIDDLRTILGVDPPDESRVIELFEDQDAIHRSELSVEAAHEPLFNILELRVRFAASLQLLGPSWRRKIPRIARHARQRLADLRLRHGLPELIRILRAAELVSWDDVLSGDFEPLRARVTKGPARRMGPKGRPVDGRELRRRRSSR